MVVAPDSRQAVSRSLIRSGRPDQRHLVDQRVRDGGRRVALLPVEEEILDPLRLGFVAVTRDEVVVEVLAARAHAADVERVVGDAWRRAALSTSSETRAGTAGAMSKSPPRSNGVGKVSRARSGEKKIGSQPSAISAASSTARGLKTAR